MRSLLAGMVGLLMWLGAVPLWAGSGSQENPLAGWWLLYAEDVRERRWHFTAELESDAVKSGKFSGEIVADTPTESSPGYFGRERIEMEYERPSRAVSFAGITFDEDLNVGTAIYEATVGAGGDVMEEGSWRGANVVPSNFWVGVRAEVVAESDFEVDAGGRSGASRWDRDEGAVVAGGDGGSVLVAPDEFHGDWSWRGKVPAMLSFNVRWIGDGLPTSGPVVVLTGSGDEASFVVDAAEAYGAVAQRTYLVPLRGGNFGPLREAVWEKEGDVPWNEFFKNIDGLTILPGSGSSGEFLVDEVRLLRPAKPNPTLVEWGFENGGLAALEGEGRLEAVVINPVTRETVPWGQGLVAGSEVVSGEERLVLHVPERTSAGNPLLDASPSLLFDRIPVGANGGGRRVNEYTVMWDLKLVGETLTDEQGSDLNSLMLEDFKKSSGIILWESGAIGGGAVVVEYGRVKGVVTPLDLTGEVSPGERDLVRGRWYRVVLVVNGTEGELVVYVDGVRVFDESELDENKRPEFDGRYSLGAPDVRGSFPSMFGAVGFTGNQLDLAGVAILDVALPEAEVAALGGVGGGGILRPVFDIGFDIDVVVLPGSMTLGFQPYPGWRYALERSEDLCLWRVMDVLPGLGERVQVEVRLDEKRAEYHRVRPIVD